MVKLPSRSTLFEYSHVENVVEGIDRTVLQSVSNRVANFPEKHKKFHVLIGDEMYISQNLVFQKSTGKMIGYTSLNHIDKEVADLEKCIDNPDAEMEEIVAEKVMVYMIKGVSNGALCPPGAASSSAKERTVSHLLCCYERGPARHRDSPYG
ncbi:Exportin-T [Frankliniella fusca]|uniref:Exportin-T n=1 Tax=Frankliniella fusca TaxID=407009 RepID=A0AAE1GX08_9NEOP|nr:Exportin-T [Frankliniella fusca]